MAWQLSSFGNGSGATKSAWQRVRLFPKNIVPIPEFDQLLFQSAARLLQWAARSFRLTAGSFRQFEDSFKPVTKSFRRSENLSRLVKESFQRSEDSLKLVKESLGDRISRVAWVSVRDPGCSMYGHRSSHLDLDPDKALESWATEQV